MKPCSPNKRNGPLCALLTTLALLNGCSDVQDQDDHGHDHGEPRTAQITVWTDHYEVFAEHPAPVAGKATQFITHVTDLQTLEPRREGMVKFLLRQGDFVAEHPQAAPARAGIYLPDIIFPKSGDWQLTLQIPVAGTNASVELGNITVYADEHSAAHADIPDALEGISFLKEQQWKVLSKTEPITKRRLVEKARLPANVRAKPGLSAVVSAPISGQLTAPNDQTLPRLGHRVEAGQLLALLRPNFSEAAARLAEADSEFNTAKASLTQAEAAYARTRQLAAVEAKSPRELQEAELAWQSAMARYAAAAGLLGTFKQAAVPPTPDAPLMIELRAPIGGVLNSMAAGAGEVVSAHAPLFTVINPESIWIQANIPEASLGRLSAAKEASLEAPEHPGRFMPVTGEGRGLLVALGLEVDAATRTVPLVYEMPNPESALRIGQSVTLLVQTARAEEALALPDEAMVEEGGRPIAFVQLSGETFEKRELTLGIRDEGWAQVLSGLKEGERVVTRGAYAVKLASMVTAIPAHGHAH